MATTNSESSQRASGLLQDGLEQILRLPTGAAVQFVVGAPILMLASKGPEGTRQGSPAQRQQRSQGLIDGAFART